MYSVQRKSYASSKKPRKTFCIVSHSVAQVWTALFSTIFFSFTSVNERITVFHFDSFTAVGAYSRFWCIVVVIDTRGFVAFCSSLDGCYELVSSIKRGFCFDDLVRLGFQHIMRSTLFFFLRSSVHCLNSLQQSTLIAVVRHLKFIDFIQLALRTNQKIKYGTSNAFSHQYLFCHNTVFNISNFFS